MIYRTDKVTYLTYTKLGNEFCCMQIAFSMQSYINVLNRYFIFYKNKIFFVFYFTSLGAYCAGRKLKDSESPQTFN